MFHGFTFDFRIVAGFGNGEPGFAFTFQIFQRKTGGTFPWNTRAARRFFTFSIKRNGAFRIFASAHGTEGRQWPCWGVTFDDSIIVDTYQEKKQDLSEVGVTMTVAEFRRKW